jgi:RNA polymerase sigma-70 factor, ECF subfamily
MDDDELIASLAGGDDTALRELFARHAPWLAARLRKALPPDDVEDVLQETFLAVWKNAKSHRPQGAAEAWLWVIARNQAALLLRRRGPAAIALLDEGPLAADPAESAAVRADLVTAAAAALGPPGCPEREDPDPAQQAVADALLAKIGAPAPDLGPPQKASAPSPAQSGAAAAQAQASAAQISAASRFQSLSSAARRAWLTTHIAALRSGAVTMAQIP